MSAIHRIAICGKLFVWFWHNPAIDRPTKQVRFVMHSGDGHVFFSFADWFLC